VYWVGGVRLQAPARGIRALGRGQGVAFRHKGVDTKGSRYRALQGAQIQVPKGDFSCEAPQGPWGFHYEGEVFIVWGKLPTVSPHTIAPLSPGATELAVEGVDEAQAGHARAHRRHPHGLRPGSSEASGDGGEGRLCQGTGARAVHRAGQKRRRLRPPLAAHRGGPRHSWAGWCPSGPWGCGWGWGWGSVGPRGCRGPLSRGLPLLHPPPVGALCRWVRHARLAARCQAGYSVPGWLLNARLATQCQAGCSMQVWLLSARLAAQCQSGYSVPGWLLNARLAAQCQSPCPVGSLFSLHLIVSCPCGEVV